MALSRRTFLKATAAGAGVTLVGMTRKSARAEEPKAKRLLVLYAGGGLRTTAAFNASTRTELNPWGVLGPAGALRLGNVLTSTPEVVRFDAPSWPDGQVPGIEEAALSFSMIAATDHAPGQPRAGDHPDDSERMGTGYFGKAGAPGLITVLNKFLGGNAPAPVAIIGGAPLSIATGAWVPFAPTSLEYYGLPDAPPQSGSPTVGRPIEDALDARVRAHRRGLGAGVVDGYLATKGSLRKYGPVLAEKTLHINKPAYFEETLGGITNRMLLEAVGVTAFSDTDPISSSDPNGGTAVRCAMGLRLLQMGSPAVCVGVGGFDTHSNEDAEAPALYTRFARYLAGIHFALSRIPDGNGTLLDSTLVVTMSEFGRSPGAANGFNDGYGSDHGGGSSWRNQAHVIFGAGITPKVLAETNDDNEPLDGKVHTTHALHATIASALGVPQAETDALWPPGSELYPEASPIFDLWS
jgi:uncharacterized protein (DUF1501 family)